MELISTTSAIETLHSCNLIQFQLALRQLHDPELSADNMSWISQAMLHIRATLTDFEQKKRSESDHHGTYFLSKLINPVLINFCHDIPFEKKRKELLILNWLLTAFPSDEPIILEYLQHLLVNPSAAGGNVRMLQLGWIEILYHLLQGKVISSTMGYLSNQSGWNLWTSVALSLLEVQSREVIVSEKDGYTRPTRLATTASDGFLFLIHFLAKDVAHENRLLSSSNNIARYCLRFLSLQASWQVNALYSTGIQNLMYYLIVMIKLNTGEENQERPHELRRRAALSTFFFQWIQSSEILTFRRRKQQRTISFFINALTTLVRLPIDGTTCELQCCHLRNVALLFGRMDTKTIHRLARNHVDKLGELVDWILQALRFSPLNIAMHHLGVAVLRFCIFQISLTSSAEKAAVQLIQQSGSCSSSSTSSSWIVDLCVDVVLMSFVPVTRIIEHSTGLASQLQNIIYPFMEQILRKEKHFNSSTTFQRQWTIPVVQLLLQSSHQVQDGLNEKICSLLNPTIAVQYLCQVAAAGQHPPPKKRVVELLCVLTRDDPSIFLTLLQGGLHKSSSKCQPIHSPHDLSKTENALVDEERLFTLLPQILPPLSERQSSHQWALQAVRKALSAPEDSQLIRVIKELRHHVEGAANDLIFPLLCNHLQTQRRLTEELLDTRSFTATQVVRDLLFVRMSPLLILKVMPTSAFDSHSNVLEILSWELITRMHDVVEYKEVRNLAVEVLAKFSPDIIVPLAMRELVMCLEILDHSTFSKLTTLLPLPERIEIQGSAQNVGPQSTEDALVWVYLLCQSISVHAITRASWVPWFMLVCWRVSTCRDSSDSVLRKVHLGCVDALALAIVQCIVPWESGESDPMILYVMSELVHTRDAMDVDLTSSNWQTFFSSVEDESQRQVVQRYVIQELFQENPKIIRECSGQAIVRAITRSSGSGEGPLWCLYRVFVPHGFFHTSHEVSSTSVHIVTQLLHQGQFHHRLLEEERMHLCSYALEGMEAVDPHIRLESLKLLGTLVPHISFRENYHENLQRRVHRTLQQTIEGSQGLPHQSLACSIFAALFPVT